ncbi:MAG TPA: hypothetical protein PKA58_14975, partial [Polyangium sp.]|nr:hypothetical protein [Polyangium sp.]
HHTYPATSARATTMDDAVSTRRGRMEGFIILDFMGRAQEAISALAGWAAEGKLKDRFDVAEGLDNAPAALRLLFEGSNAGKQLVKVREP